MNNFSPSTDTSVGTKRFTAQEVQLAYKGSVPDENIDEISKVMATAQALEANEYVNVLTI